MWPGRPPNVGRCPVAASKRSFFPFTVTSSDQVWPEGAVSLLGDPHPQCWCGRRARREGAGGAEVGLVSSVPSVASEPVVASFSRGTVATPSSGWRGASQAGRCTQGPGDGAKKQMLTSGSGGGAAEGPRVSQTPGGGGAVALGPHVRSKESGWQAREY